MKKVKIELKNCYGIKSLEQEFDFTESKSYAIYAPNGVMKTSFAKAFQDLSKGQKSEDRIFPNKKTLRLITDEAGIDIPKEQVFVVEPYEPAFQTEKMSSLLASKALKADYDTIHKTINEKKETLLKELKAISGLSKQIEETLSESITHSTKKFFDALDRVKKDVEKNEFPDYANIQYKTLFNQKAVDFLQTPDLKEKLEQYAEVYDKLLTSSRYFKKGIFNHNQASTIAKNLKANGWFDGGHTVSLKYNTETQEVSTEEELEAIIESEKQGILTDPKLSASFEKLDKTLKANDDLRDLREFLAANQNLIAELSNPALFKEKLWVSYLAKSKAAYDDLLREYAVGEKRIKEIVESAKSEVTKWLKVLDIFNKRFNVPFKVRMANQEDVILKREEPHIAFDFTDPDDGKPAEVESDELLKVLSNGERRAYYILNIIFEVQARLEDKQPTLFIVDDIADSFDYKNKYAIIEYLKDISVEPLFHQIILTHNFDFYRTVSGRLDFKRQNRFLSTKTSEGVVLEQDKYFNKNPFLVWKDQLNEDEKLIAIIPFVRNLAEYCGRDDVKLQLTSLLHQMKDTDSITVGELEKMIKIILVDKIDIVLKNHQRLVKDLIFELADKIVDETKETIELEKKIVLSIAIRLKADAFMIKKINDPEFLNKIATNQTFHLIQEFKKRFEVEGDNIECVEQVSLMTPENIHLNSFMYEPILDMSKNHLVYLYKKCSEFK